MTEKVLMRKFECQKFILVELRMSEIFGSAHQGVPATVHDVGLREPLPRLRMEGMATIHDGDAVRRVEAFTCE